MPIRSFLAPALLSLIAGAAGAEPVAVAPAARSFPLGSLTVTALRDMTNVVPNDGKVFGKDATPAAVAQVLKQAGAPTDRVTLSVDALLIRGGGRVVLIDTGLGPKVGGVLPRSLAAAGVAPGAVTDVLITHAHPDHVGGLVTATGALAFPQAAIRLSEAEWASMQARGDKALVAAIAPRVKTFAPGTMIIPGITPVSIPGHTPGHVGYAIISGDARIIDIGDTAHSAIVSLAEPDWTIGYDGDAALGKASRRATLTRLAASRQLLFAPHFPFPGVGRIVVRGTGFAFQPGLK